MCGICGVVDFRSPHCDPETVERMARTLSHRGPDCIATWCGGTASLGHTRLAIIDLTDTGKQPMVIASGEIVGAFNGEIYNFRQLRAELENEGVVFLGRSDTEVVLQAYRRWGGDVFSRLNGIFSLAIWNSITQELLLARDRFGVKPLYFHRLADGVVFGSEIKALLASNLVPREICPIALHEFMYYGAALGRRTMFQGVSRLLPGHFLRFRAGQSSETCFWQVDDVVCREDDVRTATDRVRTLLESAVRRQLVSDVPVGVFLSGGIDSSAVVAFASRHYQGRLRTYSAGFDFDKGVNELAKARRISTLFDTEHTEIHVSGSSVVDTIEQLVTHHDEPFSDAANIPLYLMCRELQGNPKVILQGDGGDELFAGYRRYAMLRFWPLWAALGGNRPILSCLRAFGSIASRAERMLEAFSSDDDAVRMALLLTMERRSPPPIRVLSKEWQGRVLAHDPFGRYKEFNCRLAHLDRVQRMLHTDMSILLPDIFLEKVDKATMAWGIESRVPFLDNDLTDYVLGLPSRMKVLGTQKKYLLRTALRGILPDEVLDGPKTGFGVPYAHWLRTSLASYAHDVFSSAEVVRTGLLDRAVLAGVMREHERGRSGNGFLLWKALNLGVWLRQYFG